MTTGQPGTGKARPAPARPARTSGKASAVPTPEGAARSPQVTDGTTAEATTNGRPNGAGAATGDNEPRPAKSDTARDGDAAKDGAGAKASDAALGRRDRGRGRAWRWWAKNTTTTDGAKDDAATDGTKDDATKNGGAANASEADKNGGTAKAGTKGDADKASDPAKDGTKDDATKNGAATKGEKAGDADGRVKTDAESKPVGADRWEAFASAPEPKPSIFSRAGRAVGRFLIHEWTLASLGALVLAVLMTWPTLRYPRYTLPQDYWDPSLQAWQMAWSGHILLADPAHLWQSNTFFPELWSFAFSDTLLGYAPAGMLGSGPEDAVLRYNIMFVLAHALATLGAYALARQLGAGRIGAAVAGVSYTYAPWLLAQAGHLHVLSNGGIPLALAMLARGHGWSLRHGYRPERRHDGWIYAGWLVAAWQLSLGFGIGLPFAYLLGGAVVVAIVLFYARRLRTRQAVPFGRRLLVADLLGGLFFAGVGLLMAFPFFKVTELHPYAERTIRDISIFSPPASGFVTAPAESRVWGGLHEGAREALPWHPEMTLLPGFVLYALALGGLFFSVWRLRHRLLLLVGVLVTMAFAMGTRFFDGTFTYVPLFEHVPGWSALRTPGRLMLWTTLLLGLLAAGAVTALTDRVRELTAQRIPSWPGPWLRTATLLPLLLVTLEGLNTTPHPVVPTQPAAMRSAEGPLLVLPSNQSLDQHVMLWSTSGFPDVVNGGSGFTPRQLDDVRRVSQSFPNQTSVDYLRTLGVRTVVLLRGQVAGTPWEISIDTPVDSLGITREDVGSAVVYRL
ncbi:hypothetical protein [Micromonospora parathelypteridis]|uniref:Uncharacterized protein n=1 Tax=Micromonospora parathelypteridis TaxID=1839617 RepID=A0A840VML8_9ACTN|nr:hypothetical protein [Micromonospora parathelypteridis]MBB5478273.1 hypothetical protein [Micromonospora parathelypteridis]GGO07087.1 hypothetical protein GCM10011576_11360 [Micromonospora parathelypteridis]